MALRQRLETVAEILRRLEAGRFMYGLECLHAGADVFSSFVSHLLQSRYSGQEGVPDPLVQDQFLKALLRFRMALWRLRPGQLCRLLDELLQCLDDVRENSNAVWLFRSLTLVQTKLELLAPARALSNLQNLAQVVQHLRSPGGFQLGSYHPDLVARLADLHFLPILDTLDEVVHDVLSPTNIQQLRFLHHFLHTPQSAPAA